MTEITALSATELSAKIRSGAVSSVEVVTAYLERIDALNGEINPIVSRVDTDLVLAQARACDADLAAGRWRGFLHGMPLAVKDLSEVAGIRCTYGSPLFADFIPDADDIHVERMRAAGAIFIGKTNTPEWGFGSHSYNPVFGTTRNPYDLTKSAGGSSGGAAAGLAARLLPLADGSDMMGSLRNPAAFNNVVGFRPSFGRVPSGPGPDLYQHQLSTAGPMGRSVRDVAALLAIQAGYDVRDPWSLPLEPLDLGGEPNWRGRRVGWLGDFGGYLPFEAGVLDLDRSALKVFEGLGMAVDEVLPDFDMDRLWWAWTTLRSWLTVGSMQDIYEDPARRALLKPEILWEIRHGLRVTAAEVYEASKIRSAWYKACLSLFETYDFLVLPSAQVFPFDAEIPWPREVADRKMDTYHRWMEVVIGPSMAGLPVAAMPAGFGGNGSSALPNGIQIVGPPRGDRATLRLALAYEEATDWLTRSAR
ncbi:amidase [Rhizobium sp. CG5]|uniref:amidase n=1 Tax=Rhizobium sp. CG5 TaxID=2726076 RepID=UPI0020336D49|nr:amidase [Rhizobium sp. CG5]MCM2475127.1 amidase [Rhizobium sp. CG5]